MYLVHNTHHHHGESKSRNSLTQQLVDKGVRSYDEILRTLDGTADPSSTLAVVPAAQAFNDANRGDRTVTETQKFCTNSSFAMEHTTTVTPQQNRASARYGQKVAN